MAEKYEERPEDHRFLLSKVSLLFAGQFAGVGIFLPFFPIFLSDRGFSDVDIGFLLAAPMITRVLCVPFLTAIADRSGRRRKAILIYSLSSALVFSSLYFTNDFWAVFVLLLLASACWTTVTPLSDAYAGDVVSAAKADYGKMRLWGSVAFILATFLGGIALQYWDSGFVIDSMVLTLIGTAVVCLFLPHISTTRKIKGQEQEREPAEQKNAISILMAPPFLTLLLVGAAIQSSHGVYYNFGSIFWQKLGISGTIIGTLWGVGVAVEVGLFWIAGRLNAYVTPAGYLCIGGVSALIRWVSFPYIEWLPGIFALQCLHGLSFGATHLGTIGLVRQMIPSRLAGSAQGLNTTLMGGLTAVVMVFSGSLYSFGPATAFLTMAGFVVCSLGVLLFAVRYWSSENAPI
ncbi:MAG: MFS transporter [Stappiaceae bacterium]